MSPDYVIELNAAVVRAHREPHRLRDRGALESACDAPRNWWAYEREADPGALAAVLLIAICRNHPFEQGNKRTAFISAQAFLRLNGLRLVIPDTVEVAQLIVDVIVRTADEELFIELFAACAHPR